MEKQGLLDVFSKEMLTEYQSRVGLIQAFIRDTDTNLEAIAFHLYWIYYRQAYRCDGFDNIYSCSKERFGYSKSTCYSMINVVGRFAQRDEAGEVLEEFSPRAQGYSISKLSLMAGLTDAQISALKPEMSVRDIKKYVQSLQGKALPELPEGSAPEESAEPEPGTGEAPQGKGYTQEGTDNPGVEMANPGVEILYSFDDSVQLEELFTEGLSKPYKDALNLALITHPGASIKIMVEY